MNPTTETTFIDWIDLRQNWRETEGVRRGFRLRSKDLTADEAAAIRAAFEAGWQDLPLVHGTVRARAEQVVEQVSEDGKVYYLLAGDRENRKENGVRYCSKRHEGSHSTSVIVQSDGEQVRISGNVGRLDRLDNVWNYRLEDTITKASTVVRSYGLPEFSRGQEYLRDTISAHDRERGVSAWKWSGAFMNELHVTRNYYAGSEKLACDAMQSMSAFRSSRISKGSYGNETLNFGMPTKKGQRLRKAIVVYRKAAEMLAHAKGDDERKRIKASPEYQMAQDLGLIRFECKWGRDFLRDHNLRYWGAADMGKIISLFDAETAFLLNADPGRVNRVVADMPPKVRAAALLWIQGQDLRTLYPRSTYFRHVKSLRDYGIDASEARNVGGRPNSEEALQRLLEAHKTFELRPMAAPEWYGLPEVRRAA